MKKQEYEKNKKNVSTQTIVTFNRSFDTIVVLKFMYLNNIIAAVSKRGLIWAGNQFYISQGSVVTFLGMVEQQLVSSAFRVLCTKSY